MVHFSATFEWRDHFTGTNSIHHRNHVIGHLTLNAFSIRIIFFYITIIL